jgi:hypothetical protein
MRPKISRDQRRIRNALKHGHDAGMKIALEIVERQDSAKNKPPTRSARKEMITSETDFCWPPPFLTRVIRKPISLDGETK